MLVSTHRLRGTRQRRQDHLSESFGGRADPTGRAVRVLLLPGASPGHPGPTRLRSPPRPGRVWHRPHRARELAGVARRRASGRYRLADITGPRGRTLSDPGPVLVVHGGLRYRRGRGPRCPGRHDRARASRLGRSRAGRSVPRNPAEPAAERGFRRTVEATARRVRGARAGAGETPTGRDGRQRRTAGRGVEAGTTGLGRGGWALVTTFQRGATTRVNRILAFSNRGSPTAQEAGPLLSSPASRRRGPQRSTIPSGTSPRNGKRCSTRATKTRGRSSSALSSLRSSTVSKHGRCWKMSSVPSPTPTTPSRNTMLS